MGVRMQVQPGHAQHEGVPACFADDISAGNVSCDSLLTAAAVIMA